jgi:23S rRNA pseudouridine1911/1915/1917 synthase
VTRRIRFRVDATEAGQRLDKVLVAREPSLSRRVTSELFATSRVWVDGRPARKGELARAGTEVEFDLPAPPRARPDPAAWIDVVLERPDLVVVNKPAGQPTAPLDGEEGGTVANALAERYPETRAIGHHPLEPGLLHRLDTGTSGLLVATRTQAAFDVLKRALGEGQLRKRYLAIVAGEGLADAGAITKPIAPHPRSARRVMVCDDPAVVGARAAQTHWRVLQRSAEWALVEVEVSRAVRHQIRVHFAALGHPLVGDGTYAGPRCRGLGAGHALHASYVAWAGDRVVPAFEVEAALPDGMGVLMRG